MLAPHPRSRHMRTQGACQPCVYLCMCFVHCKTRRSSSSSEVEGTLFSRDGVTEHMGWHTARQTRQPNANVASVHPYSHLEYEGPPLQVVGSTPHHTHSSPFQRRPAWIQDCAAWGAEWYCMRCAAHLDLPPPFAPPAAGPAVGAGQPGASMQPDADAEPHVQPGQPGAALSPRSLTRLP